MTTADAADRRKADRIRQQADARWSAAVAALGEGVLIVGVDDVVETANPAALSLLGAESLVGTRFSDLDCLLDESETPFPTSALGLQATRSTGAARPATTVSVRRGGGAVDTYAPLAFLSVSIRALPAESGDGPYPVVICFLDVTDRHATAAILRHEATHDQMTGLANRSLVLAAVAEHLKRPGVNVGVLFIDLDRFKMVNDSLGHDAGDTVLRTMAGRLAGEAPPECTVGRLAGDEFVLVAPGHSERLMQALARRLLARLCEPVRIAGRDVVVTCSIGIAVARTAAGDADPAAMAAHATEVLRNADVAMYYAKNQGRNQLATFDERFRRRAIDRLELEEDLRTGIDHDEIWPAFQPIVSVQGSQIVSAEALARWTHAERGTLPPNVFIPIAEETGLIVPLGEFMLHRAVESLSRWRRRGAHDLVISVNFSPRQLTDPQVAQRIGLLLDSYKLPASALTLEITESALMEDPQLAAQTLGRLRDLGVGIAVDDFGTGYSSLSYLRRFPVTSVKIDRSFIECLGQARDAAIVAGIISLAHSLGLTVVAEGVEDASQREILRTLECDYAQGFLFSKPLSARAFSSALNRSAMSGLGRTG